MASGQPPSDGLRRLVIVGGGTAGWITAGVLAARFPQRGEQGFSVTLIESRLQPPIGVGEGTWPTIRATLQQIGVSESAFLRECDGSFKQGTQFNGWGSTAPRPIRICTPSRCLPATWTATSHSS